MVFIFWYDFLRQKIPRNYYRAVYRYTRGAQTMVTAIASPVAAATTAAAVAAAGVAVTATAAMPGI